MRDDQHLVPATPEDVQRALLTGLHGRRRFARRDDLMVQMLAEHLFEHLKRSGYVVLRSREDGEGF